MPVAETELVATYASAGTVGPYTITIPRDRDEDLKLLVDGVASTDFTVDPNNNEFSTGTITPVDTVLTLYRETPFTQTQPFPSNTTPAAEDVRAGLDKNTLILQELGEGVDRAVKPPIGSTFGSNSTIGVGPSGLPEARTQDEQRAHLGITDSGTLPVTVVSTNTFTVYTDPDVPPITLVIDGVDVAFTSTGVYNQEGAAADIANTINAGAYSVTAVASGQFVTVSARASGAAGNGITCTVSVGGAYGEWATATTEGGTLTGVILTGVEQTLTDEQQVQGQQNVGLYGAPVIVQGDGIDPTGATPSSDGLNTFFTTNRLGSYFFPKGYYWLDKPVILKANANYQGAGSTPYPADGHDPATAVPPGTVFFVKTDTTFTPDASGINSMFISETWEKTADDWMHWFSFRNMAVDGNEIAHHGVAVYQMGEVSGFYDCNLSGCLKSDMWATGAHAPFTVENCSINGAPASENPSVTATSPVTATATVTVNAGVIDGYTITNPGTNYYTNTDIVTFSGGGGSGAAATAIIGDSGLNDGKIIGLLFTDLGSGYTSTPTVTIAAPPTTAYDHVRVVGESIAEATATINAGVVDSITVTAGGSGYPSDSGTTVVSITPPLLGGTQATATAIIASGVITGFTITDGGSGYTAAPIVTIQPGIDNLKRSGIHLGKHPTLAGSSGVCRINTLSGDGNHGGIVRVSGGQQVVLTGPKTENHFYKTFLFDDEDLGGGVGTGGGSASLTITGGYSQDPNAGAKPGEEMIRVENGVTPTFTAQGYGVTGGTTTTLLNHGYVPKMVRDISTGNEIPIVNDSGDIRAHFFSYGAGTSQFHGNMQLGNNKSIYGTRFSTDEMWPIFNWPSNDVVSLRAFNGSGAGLVDNGGVARVLANQNGVGFNGQSPVGPIGRTVTGVRGSESFNASFLTLLETYGLITDSTTTSYGGVALQQYTVGTLPAPSGLEGLRVEVTDLNGRAVDQTVDEEDAGHGSGSDTAELRSNGTDWINLQILV